MIHGVGGSLFKGLASLSLAPSKGVFSFLSSTQSVISVFVWALASLSLCCLLLYVCFQLSFHSRSLFLLLFSLSFSFSFSFTLSLSPNSSAQSLFNSCLSRLNLELREGWVKTHTVTHTQTHTVSLMEVCTALKPKTQFIAEPPRIGASVLALPLSQGTLGGCGHVWCGVVGRLYISLFSFSPSTCVLSHCSC